MRSPADMSLLKRLVVCLPLLLLALGLVDCVEIVTSLNPIYTEETLTYDRGLEGTWLVEEDDDHRITMSFEPLKKNTYLLRYRTRSPRDPEKFFEVELAARLAAIGDHMFLDLHPEGGTDDGRPHGQTGSEPVRGG